MNQARASLAVLGVVVMVAGWPLSLRAGPAEANEVKLKAETLNNIASVVTPRKVRPEKAFFSFQGAKGNIQVAGQSVAAGAMLTTAGRLFGLDQDGDGKIEAKDLSPLTIEGVAGAKVQLPGDGKKREAALYFTHLLVGQGENAKVTFVSGRVFSATCYRGAVSGVPVRVVDDNLDGKIAQDGTDAIFVGSGSVAMPLMKVHQIGNARYELKVAEDGSTLAYTRITDEKTGVVDAPLLRSSGVRSVIVTDAATGRCLDLVTSKGAVPAGTYSLAYGVIPNGRDFVAILPTAKTPTYEVQADSTNTLRLGPPLRLTFSASVVNNEIKISPSLAVLGSGSELYAVDYRGMSQPMVVMMDGSRVLITDAMGYG